MDTHSVAQFALGGINYFDFHALAAKQSAALSSTVQHVMSRQLDGTKEKEKRAC